MRGEGQARRSTRALTRQAAVILGQAQGFLFFCCGGSTEEVCGGEEKKGLGAGGFFGFGLGIGVGGEGRGELFAVGFGFFEAAFEAFDSAAEVAEFFAGGEVHGVSDALFGLVDGVADAEGGAEGDGHGLLEALVAHDFAGGFALHELHGGVEHLFFDRRHRKTPGL